MDQTSLDKIIKKVENENRIFADKSSLDSLSIPSEIIGRDSETEKLVQYLASHKNGHVVPAISVYGRSGAGKSTLVKFICNGMPDISYCFINLRKSKTVFGIANLILGELGQPNLKSSEGMNMAIDKIGFAIESILKNEKKTLFVLVLDEFDVLFNDMRGKPSDFLYKLADLTENLRKKKYLLCTVMISNNVASDYELDDRVRSRIGSSEVFFEPYSHNDVVKMLRDRAKKAFSIPVSDEVLQQCASLSSSEHGDARRAIDLLRVAGEIAGRSEYGLDKYTVESAHAQLQEDRISKILSSASYHLKFVAYCLAWLCHVNGGWPTISAVYDYYCKNIAKDQKPLGYRRVAELLVDVQNSGLATSQSMARSKGGYGRGYKLEVEPKDVGEACFPGKWEIAEKMRVIEAQMAGMAKEKKRLNDIALRASAKKHPEAVLRNNMREQLENNG